MGVEGLVLNRTSVLHPPGFREHLGKGSGKNMHGVDMSSGYDMVSVSKHIQQLCTPA